MVNNINRFGQSFSPVVKIFCVLWLTGDSFKSAKWKLIKLNVDSDMGKVSKISQKASYSSCAITKLELNPNIRLGNLKRRGLGG